ncbi:hypothetical protein [Komagataeibacter sp. FNDCF1]|uniref:hypothetical protein n=1 Tax=Komagataeibacter sp. FNDCF1 TaxID=2878681 RepID=UPI001E298EE6|nr:hypothetical protein [Komagataeibacter sp. FNDCF1]MCE2563670.1 hypothetical protein [Komagataeibacter sp. FNDCF1]
MDRQIVYPAQIPLDSDQLNAQRNAYVGIGQLAAMAYGWATVSASGFACTPGSGLVVTIAPGSLLAPGVVDGAAYGTLTAVGSALVRQYISRDPVTLDVPGAGATCTVYVTPATVDADDTVLPFYNAADPSVTYAGADNSGKTAPTVRQDVAQIGVGTSVPDGAYPLWTVTVPAGATAITADMIAQAGGAPFYDTIPQLQAAKQDALGFVPVNGQWALGTTAYQVLGLTYLISAQRPQYFYQDATGAQHAGGALALYSDVTSETERAEDVESGLVSGIWAKGTSAYQITGLTYLISSARPQFFYQDDSGNQYSGGLIALYSDVTAEQAARASAISAEATARANADAQLVSGVWANGTGPGQVLGMTYNLTFVGGARPQVFYNDASDNQQVIGLATYNDLSGYVPKGGVQYGQTWDVWTPSANQVTNLTLTFTCASGGLLMMSAGVYPFSAQPSNGGSSNTGSDVNLILDGTSVYDDNVRSATHEDVPQLVGAGTHTITLQYTANTATSGWVSQRAKLSYFFIPTE